jgi:hypothetical protein
MPPCRMTSRVTRAADYDNVTGRPLDLRRVASRRAPR